MDRYIVSTSRRGWIAALALAALVAAGAAGLPACDQGAQGDRCNPYLIEPSAASSPNGGAYNADECNSGLTCQIPPTCVIAVCCPSKPPYSDPNCECLANPGAQCACTVQELDGGPWEDAGSEDSGGSDAGSLDAGHSGDAAAPTDSPSDAPIDAATDAAG